MSQAIAATQNAGQAEEDFSQRLGTYAHWALRAALASVFIYHGAQKLSGLDQFAHMMNLPYIVALLVALAEFVGGILVAIGGLTRDWVTRLGASLFIPVMAGAIALVHWGQWSFVPTQSYRWAAVSFR